MDEQTPIPRKGMTPVLRMAVLAGLKASVKLHLRLGGVVDALDDKGRTPLILAASRGHVEICRFLLDAGADPTHADIEGHDALRVATAKGHYAVAELIHAAMASPSEPSPIPLQMGEVEGPSVGGTAADCSCTSQATSSPIPEGSALAPVGAGSEPVATALVPEAVSDPPVAGEGTSSKTAQDAGHGPNSLQFWQYAKESDLSRWEEETESPPPPVDSNYAKQADKLQRRLSFHTPVDLDEGWDDVDIDLPDILADVRRRAKLDPEEETVVRQLVLAATADGRIRGEFLALVAPRDRDDADLPDADYVANLRMTLGDMGVIVDDDPDAPDRPSSPDDEDDRLRDEVAEGLAFLRALNSNGADPIAHYISNLPRDRLTRDDEASLVMEIERGTRAALAAAAMSPAAVCEILAAIEAIFMGEMAPEELLESDDEGEDDDTDLDENGEQAPEAAAMPATLSLAPELLFRLGAIRDLCRRLSRSQDSSIAERLGDELAALGLSHAFVSHLRCTVGTDPSGNEARRLMEAGLEIARRARERFALANLKLVVWGAKRFGGLTWSDRIQEGNLGLLKAVERFDHRRGAKFSTYAHWWIKQAVMRGVADKGRTIRIPVHAQDAIRKVRRAESQVFALTGREAAPEVIADLTEIPLASVRRLLTVVEEPFSLDAEAGLLNAD